ncbi:hypothetical protein PR048_018673 [Dryococelus australis]|uniref:Uncharacterized protein n=1 Tax=Dryococelus australis TaxID=614101 RepID=A0ABQ9HD29_9NEOP|nr:hypothetical protein PR048_018673 [Dryococelus australis]
MAPENVMVNISMKTLYNNVKVFDKRKQKFKVGSLLLVIHRRATSLMFCCEYSRDTPTRSSHLFALNQYGGRLTNRMGATPVLLMAKARTNMVAPLVANAITNIWSSIEMQKWGKWENLEKTCQPAAPISTITICENLRSFSPWRPPVTEMRNKWERKERRERERERERKEEERRKGREPQWKRTIIMLRADARTRRELHAGSGSIRGDSPQSSPQLSRSAPLLGRQPGND